MFYSLFLFLYGASAQLLALKNPKAKKWLEGQEGLLKHIKTKLKGQTGFIWFHCASLGEFEQGRPLIEKIKQENPTEKILLTFFSPSGYEVRKTYHGADHVFYLPFDKKSNVSAFLDMVKPKLAVFVKYEFWLNYFYQLHHRKIPLIIMSALFRPGQAYFKWFAAPYQKAFKKVNHFFVQDKQSAAMLEKAGVMPVSIDIAADTRIDRVSQIAANVKPIPSIDRFTEGSKVLIGGSIYDRENRMLFSAREKGLVSTKLILAPHHIDSTTIAGIKSVWGEAAILYSGLIDDYSLENKEVLIVDTIGMLSTLYQYGYMAFIGGGFGKSIHNTLEPAALGLPVIFGPAYKKFTEAVAMTEAEAAFPVKDQDGFEEVLRKLSNPSALQKASQEARSFISNNTGGTELIYNWLSARKFV